MKIGGSEARPVVALTAHSEGEVSENDSAPAPQYEMGENTSVNPHHATPTAKSDDGDFQSAAAGGPIITVAAVNRPRACIFFPW
jgi:hypothetical protein